MKKLIFPGLFLALAGFGCGESPSTTHTAARAETVTIGSESDVIGAESDDDSMPPTTYARQECSLSEVQFEAGSDTMTDEGYSRLSELGQCVQAGEINRLTVMGNDDPQMEGEEAHKLATRRAMIVVDFLMDEGVQEPDVSYSAENGSESFVLVWPEAVVAAVPTNQI